MNLTIDLALSLLGIVFGVAGLVAAFILNFITSERRISRIEPRISMFLTMADNILSQCSQLNKDISELKRDQNSYHPDLSIFLATQSKFVEKSFRFRLEKHAIARKIATKYIGSKYRVLLDSGSTTDLVTAELLTSPAEGVHIYSNNIFAAMHLVGTKRVHFTILPGKFSENFAAVYPDNASQAIGPVDCDIIIVAGTALRFKEGLMVESGDKDNKDFKSALLSRFRNSLDCKLIIAVDSSKLAINVSDQVSVISSNEWAELLERRRGDIIVVTSRPKQSSVSNQTSDIEIELNRFRNAHIEVDDDDF